MKTYTFELIVSEGNDEFWEGLRNKSGCDEILEIIEEMLRDNPGFDAAVRLIRYTDE